MKHDLSPVQITGFEVNHHKYSLIQTLNLPVTYDEKYHHYVVDYPDLNIIAFADSRDALQKELQDQLRFLWNSYVECDPIKLSSSAILLAERLRVLVRK
jgi:hypothetical protein